MGEFYNIENTLVTWVNSTIKNEFYNTENILLT